MPDHDTIHNLRDDTAFLMRLRDGDDDAFDLLANKYGGPLIGHASRIVGSVESAREVVQDVFLQLWRTRTQIEPDWDIASYLYGLTRRRAINVVRSEQTTSQREYRWVTQHQDDASPSPSSDEGDDQETRNRSVVWDALNDLSPRCREVFLLVWDHRMPYAEIAKRLGLAEPTVRRHMSRAMQHLADVLGPRSNAASLE